MRQNGGITKRWTRSRGGDKIGNELRGWRCHYIRSALLASCIVAARSSQTLSHLLIDTFSFKCLAMAELQTTCSKCDVPILQSTADDNDGFCGHCKSRRSGGFKLDLTPTETVEFSMRLFLGALFSVMGFGLGCALGSQLGTVSAFVVAIAFAVVGFVYGCFKMEIDALVWAICRLFFHH